MRISPNFPPLGTVYLVFYIPSKRNIIILFKSPQDASKQRASLSSTRNIVEFRVDDFLNFFSLKYEHIQLLFNFISEMMLNRENSNLNYYHFTKTNS